MYSMSAFVYAQKWLHLFLTGLFVTHHQNKILPSDFKHLHKSEHVVSKHLYTLTR